MTPVDDEEAWNESAHFIGPCTCLHDMEEHGWGSCDADGCYCEAGWEE